MHTCLVATKPVESVNGLALNKGSHGQGSPVGPFLEVSSATFTAMTIRYQHKIANVSKSTALKTPSRLPMFIPGAEQSGQPSLKPEPLAGLGLQAGMRKSVQKRSRAVLSGFFSTYAAVSGSPQGISGLR